MEIGKNIQKYRKKKGLTHQQLADYLGVHVRNISFYEREERYPPIDKLIELADLFEVSLDQLVGRTSKWD